MKEIRVSAVIIHKDGKIFATERGYGEWKDYWEFPGGKREEGESGEDAAVREIKEELNTLISIERFLMTIEYDYPSFHLTMDTYIAAIKEGEIILKEHEDGRWLTPSELDSLSWLPADRLIISRLKEETL